MSIEIIVKNPNKKIHVSELKTGVNLKIESDDRLNGIMRLLYTADNNTNLHFSEPHLLFFSTTHTTGDDGKTSIVYIDGSQSMKLSNDRNVCEVEASFTLTPKPQTSVNNLSQGDCFLYEGRYFIRVNRPDKEKGVVWAVPFNGGCDGRTFENDWIMKDVFSLAVVVTAQLHPLKQN